MRAVCSQIRRVAASCVVLLVVAATPVFDAGAVTAETIRVSVDSNGVEGNGHSFAASISADGRLVAFASDASNLVAGDTNGYDDIFVYDRETGRTRLVSRSSSGDLANGHSAAPAISPDGRFVAFESNATNLAGSDTGGNRNIFIRDREKGRTRMVSLTSAGAPPNGFSITPSLSPDGRFVVFESTAANMVGGDTNGVQDIFIRDREAGTTRRISVSSSGVQASQRSDNPSVSADGRFVVFDSPAPDLVPGDTNGDWDVFIRDRETRRTRRVSLSSTEDESDGFSSSPSISRSGRFVAFWSNGSNLVLGDTNFVADVFVRDRETGLTTRVSVSTALTQANGGSVAPSISAGGRYIAFQSDASNLVGGEDTNGLTDIYVHDRGTGETKRASVNSAGTIQANDNCYSPAISADGRYIAFESDASSLIVGDTNGHRDVYLRGPLR